MELILQLQQHFFLFISKLALDGKTVSLHLVAFVVAAEPMFSSLGCCSSSIWRLGSMRKGRSGKHELDGNGKITKLGSNMVVVNKGADLSALGNLPEACHDVEWDGTDWIKILYKKDGAAKEGCILELSVNVGIKDYKKEWKMEIKHIFTYLLPQKAALSSWSDDVIVFLIVLIIGCLLYSNRMAKRSLPLLSCFLHLVATLLLFGGLAQCAKVGAGKHELDEKGKITKLGSNMVVVNEGADLYALGNLPEA